MINTVEQKNILTDKMLRKHNYLRISLTEKCNLRCTYCMPADGVQLTPKNSLMNVDEIFSIAKIFVDHGVNKIRLTGGEPLVRKDFSEILKRLNSLNADLSLTTNGILVDRFIDDFKVNLAMSLSSIINILDPDAFIFGGGVSNEIDFLTEVDSLVKKFVIGKEYEGVFLKPKFGDASGVRGAARLGRSATY